jgi:serine/threonine protein phosphatase PrpC
LTATGFSLLIIVGDAAGHGLPAAMQARATRLLLNEMINDQNISKPDAILSHLNQILYRTPQEANNAVDSTSMRLAYINVAQSQLCLSRAGDCRAYRIANRRVDELTKTLRGNALGAMPPSISQYQTQCFPLNEDDLILVCSDGLIDAAQDLVSWLGQIDTTSAEAARASIQKKLDAGRQTASAGSEGREDDITCVCIKVTQLHKKEDTVSWERISSPTI